MTYLLLCALLMVLPACGAVHDAVPSPSPAPSSPSAAPPTPTPAPTPTPDPEAARAAELLSGMSLREKLCQMLITTPAVLTGGREVTTAGDGIRAGLAQYPVGGLFYNKTNMVDKAQVTEMLRATQTCSDIPLLLTCDEEGGRVSRLMSTVGTTRVGPMLDYRDEGPGTARENARTIAGDMAGLGFNMDLAPVADVWSNRENTVIGDRAYSDDFEEAARLIPAAVEGFHEGGTACVLKHFPGHGDTSEDSHEGSAYVHRTLDELRSGELLPFQAGVDAGADGVMIGHLIVPSVSEEPALFSTELVTGLLREEMGFDGVVMTDSLEMKAVTEHYGVGETAVRAVEAGVDLLLCPQDLDETLDALTQAVEAGRLTRARIDESVRRVLMLKLRRGVL